MKEIPIHITILILVVSFLIYMVAGFCILFLLKAIGINMQTSLYTSSLMGVALMCIAGMKNSLFPE